MSARWYLRGPSIGPLHTTLASGRIGGTRRRRRSSPAWSRRFGTLWYWLLGVWAVEAAFWTLVGLAMLAVFIVATWKAHHKPVQAAAGSESITP